MMGTIKLTHSTSGIWFLGRYSEHRKQTTLKHAGCFHELKMLRCANVGNQDYTRMVYHICGHDKEPQNTRSDSWMEKSLKSCVLFKSVLFKITELL